jgi:hypothetical protein
MENSSNVHGENTNVSNIYAWRYIYRQYRKLVGIIGEECKTKLFNNHLEKNLSLWSHNVKLCNKNVVNVCFLLSLNIDHWVSINYLPTNQIKEGNCSPCSPRYIYILAMYTSRMVTTSPVVGCLFCLRTMTCKFFHSNLKIKNG